MSTELVRNDTPTAPATATAPYVTPPVDVFRGENGWLIRADLPGVETEDLSIDLHESRLTIEAARRRGPGDQPEFGRPDIGGYRRTLVVPEVVDADRIEARLSDGVLELVLPRDERSRSRRIAVNGG